MKIEKIITTTIPLEIEIKDITLLSIDEYEACKNTVPLVDDWWWLRSPGNYCNNVTYVDYDGYVNIYGRRANFGFCGVRPALIFESNYLQFEDKVKILNYTWTVISNNMMLCDDVVGQTCFNKDYETDNTNNYEKSDIKVWLHKWWKERAKKCNETN